MMKKCKAIALLLSAAMTLGLFGCGNSATGSVDSTEIESAVSAGSSASDGSTSDTAVTVGYEDKIFDTSYVHEINVEISEEDWADLLANPLEKTKYETNVTIDGETIEDVSFATKGNTSLSFIASDADSDRYSFKINFGKYVDDQTYYGLDKLNLNNIYADATYMKDYLSYTIFAEAGVAAPLVSYVSLSINGEPYGLYLAIEEIGDSYLARTADGEGELYKPETDQLDNTGGGGGKQMGQQDGSAPEMPADGTMPDGMEMPTDGTMPDGMDFPTDGTMPDGMQAPDDAGQFGDNAQAGDVAQTGDNTQSDNTDAATAENAQTGDSAQSDGSDAAAAENAQTGDSAQSDSTNAAAAENAQTGDSAQSDSTDAAAAGKMGHGGFGGGMQGGGGMSDFSSDNGASLRYTDDETDSYSDIFDNTETDSDEEDWARVIAALKNLSEGNVEEALDVEEVIRYFVAHNFVLNYDSYTGSMLHNYYLYENDGILSILPWDYNLAFGAFSMGGGSNDATSIINTGIDTPLSGTSGSSDSRPLWSFITANEEYLELYHTIYDEFISSYFESGKCTEEITRVYEMIRPYVETDATAFYTVDEFDAAYETLVQFVTLRAESIRKQLDGELSTSTNDQEEADKVDASSVEISVMGSQNMGNGGGFDKQDKNGGWKNPGGTQSQDGADQSGTQSQDETGAAQSGTESQDGADQSGTL
jgi:spore coat protein CotH